MIKVFHNGYGVIQELPSLERYKNERRHGVLYLLPHDEKIFRELDEVEVRALTDKENKKFVLILADKNGHFAPIKIEKGTEKYRDKNGNVVLKLYSHEELTSDSKVELTQHLEPQVSNDTEKPLSEKERKTYQNIIVALLDYIKGDLPQIEKHPSFASEADMIALISKQFNGYQGLSKTTLERKFSDSKKSFSEQ
jgi:hypothetical protein